MVPPLATPHRSEPPDDERPRRPAQRKQVWDRQKHPRSDGRHAPARRCAARAPRYVLRALVDERPWPGQNNQFIVMVAAVTSRRHGFSHADRMRSTATSHSWITRRASRRFKASLSAKWPPDQAVRTGDTRTPRLGAPHGRDTRLQPWYAMYHSASPSAIPFVDPVTPRCVDPRVHHRSECVGWPARGPISPAPLCPPATGDSESTASSDLTIPERQRASSAV